MTNTYLFNWCVALIFAVSASAATFAAPIEAQQSQQTSETCTGTVRDEEGNPLPGATIRVEGTGNGCATNIDGHFSLADVAKGAKISVSFIGYETQTIVWNGQPLTISLVPIQNVLDDIVVIGYGVKQKRANVTNSVAKVSSEALTVGANANPAQALVGAVSGVRVNVTTGDPGATPSITVRGGSNFDGGSNEPLIVVDGQIRSSLSDINPNDIESMQILKDAGATALYGARAGNGVVLITTKQGKAGQSRVTLSMKVGINSYKDQGYDICSSEDFFYYYRTGKYNSQWALPGGGYANQFTDLFTNTNSPAGPGPATYSPWQNYNVVQRNADTEWLMNYGWKAIKDPVGESEFLYKDTDIWNEIRNKRPLTQEYNITFQGGNDRGSYYASLGYYDADGAVKSTYYKRYNFAFTGGYKLNEWLEANSVFNFTRANWLTHNPEINTAYISNRGRFWKNVNFEGLEREVDENGNETVSRIPMKGNNGPVNVNVNKGRFERDNESEKFQMTQSLTAKILEGLTLKGTMSWYYNETYNTSFNRNYAVNNAGAYYQFHNELSGSNNSQHRTSAKFERYFDQTYNLVANFSRTFAEKHSVNVMAGTEFYHRRYRGFDASGYGAPTQDFPNLGLTQNTKDVLSRAMNSNELKEALISYFGRIEYNYMERYLLAATFREDGYSRLIDNRWGFFPGISAGWVFTNENFFKNFGLDWLNYGKIRSSYGMNAVINDKKLGYYTLRGAYSSFQYDGNIGYRISALPNPKLKWERVRTFEVGLDLGFLQNRFNLGLTYYNRLTLDKFAQLDLPRTTGFSSVDNNNGSYRNQGIEIDIDAHILRTKDFTWTLGANFTYNYNNVVKLPYNKLPNNRQDGVEVYTGNGDETYYIGGYQEGQNPYQQVGFGVVKLLRSQADVDALGDYIDIAGSYGKGVYATEAGRQRLVAMGYNRNNLVQLTPGEFAYEDRNGDNMIDSKDQKVIGHSDVRWSGGLNTTFNWKGLQLYARLDMGFGFQVYESNMSFWLAEGQGAMAFPKEVRDTWTPDNPNAKYPRITWANQYGADSYVRTNSFFCQDGNYVAFRELSLSYQLPEAICKKLACQGLSISVTGQNLGYLKKCTIPLPDNTTYWTGGTAGNGGTYNLPRTVLFGLNVSF